MFKKDYELDEAFNIFEKIHKCNKLNEYRLKTDNNTNNKVFASFIYSPLLVLVKK